MATILVGCSQASDPTKEKEAPKGAALKMFVFRDDCFDKFFVNKEFTDMECIKFTISKAIGLAIIVGSGIVKVPQVLKIMSNKSVEGISPAGYYIEVSIIQNPF